MIAQGRLRRAATNPSHMSETGNIGKTKLEDKRTHTRRKTNEAHKYVLVPDIINNLIIVYILWLLFSGHHGAQRWK